MKKLAWALLALLLAACLAAGALGEPGYAGAEYYDEYYEHATPPGASWVRVTADTAVRCRPDAAADRMERAYAGSEYEYMGRTQYDDGGAAWYCVYCYGYLGWIDAASATLG